ncbi:MAG: YebC/PmpR family DNA-binding transcriptional regulator [Planctomycetia bacterium]|nr:YebC/PmpR family DNA-binding transcriptional regulator [Planctomycetia bacterium]
MSGHSHWAGIKHKKALVDAKRGKQWSKLSKAIIIAAKQGGGDPDNNLRLRAAIEEAKAVSLPKDNIARAIKRGTGELDSVELEEVVYEGYGPSGVAVIAAGLTDNRNRTAPEIRKIFEVSGGKLGATGCVSWNFDKKGIFTVPADQMEEEKLMEVALECGADDVVADGDDAFEITCAPENFDAVARALESAGIKPIHSDIEMISKEQVEIKDIDTARSVMRLMDVLDEHEDIQKVSTNFTISDEIMEQLENE